MMFSTLLREFKGCFRISSSELTAANSAGHCSKVCDLHEERQNPQKPNKMPCRSSLRFEVKSHIQPHFTNATWIVSWIVLNPKFHKADTYGILRITAERYGNQSVNTRFSWNQQSYFTMLISLKSNNEESCDAWTDALNGRVESVGICISAICIDNIPAKNDQNNETSSNGHSCCVENTFDWRLNVRWWPRSLKRGQLWLWTCFRSVKHSLVQPPDHLFSFISYFIASCWQTWNRRTFRYNLDLQ